MFQLKSRNALECRNQCYFRSVCYRPHPCSWNQWRILDTYQNNKHLSKEKTNFLVKLVKYCFVLNCVALGSFYKILAAFLNFFLKWRPLFKGGNG